MRKVVFDPPAGLTPDQVAWWERWLERARRKQQDYVEKHDRGEPVEFDSTVWRDLKDWLLRNVFFRKCAYCEAQILAIYPGDGEHYRPKGNVTVKVDGVRRRIGTGADGATHPGYYWLAYDWRNLLPACYACNNAKSDQFPVRARHVHDPVPDPGLLDQNEDPLLIYPYRDDPDDYLVFGPFGIVGARDGDPRGLATIEVFDLNRDELVDARLQRQTESNIALANAINRALAEQKPIREFLGGWIDPAAPYSKAVQAHANDRLGTLDTRV